MKKIIKSLLGGLVISMVLAALFPSAFLTDDARWTYQNDFGRVDVTFTKDAAMARLMSRGKIYNWIDLNSI